MPIKFVIILSLILSGTSFVIGSQFFSKSQTPPSTSPNTPGQNVVNQGSTQEASVSEMPENLKIEANKESNIKATINAIEQLKQEENPSGTEVLSQIKSILSLDFDYSIITKNNPNEQEKSRQSIERIKLSEAIYSYQSQKGITPTGYIENEDNTYKSLRDKIIEPENTVN